MSTINYEARKNEMISMRNIDGLSLQKIAEKHNISRERVRQIIGNTGKDFRKTWTINIINSKKYTLQHYKDLQEVPGVKNVWTKDWGKTRHTALGGNPRLGQIFEDLASKILENNNIYNDLMPNNHPFDIKTKSGIRIDVKITNLNVCGMKSQIKNKYPCYQVPYLKSGSDCDFFFIFIPDEKEECKYTYFIVPSFEIKKISKYSRIRIPWPSGDNRTSKWHKYHKRLDLLVAAL